MALDTFISLKYGANSEYNSLIKRVSELLSRTLHFLSLNSLKISLSSFWSVLENPLVV